MTGWRVVAAGAVLLAGCADPAPAPEASSTVPSATASRTTEPGPTAPDTTEPGATTPSTTPSPTATPPASTDDATTDATTDDVATDAATEAAPPPFTATIDEVVGHPAEARMRGGSWREGCPVPLEDLRHVTVTHHDMDGGTQTGELVVHADVVADVVAAFERLFELGFPITQMRLVDDFGADDDASMRADNTSAFNCRPVAGTDRWSNHAYGTAIDINPLRNPYVRGDRVDPSEGAPYADRSDHRPGMLHAGSPEVAAFTDLGWDWGGAWSSGKDYQHVSATGG